MALYFDADIQKVIEPAKVIVAEVMTKRPFSVECGDAAFEAGGHAHAFRAAGNPFWSAKGSASAPPSGSLSDTEIEQLAAEVDSHIQSYNSGMKGFDLQGFIALLLPLIMEILKRLA